jgi:hypothetical protein
VLYGTLYHILRTGQSLQGGLGVLLLQQELEQGRTWAARLCCTEYLERRTSWEHNHGLKVGSSVALALKDIQGSELDQNTWVIILNWHLFQFASAKLSSSATLKAMIDNAACSLHLARLRVTSYPETDELQKQNFARDRASGDAHASLYQTTSSYTYKVSLYMSKFPEWA